MNADRIPSEFAIGGIYFSPLLVAAILGVMFAWILTRVLNRLGLARLVWWPPLFFLALCVICTYAVDIFLVSF